MGLPVKPVTAGEQTRKSYERRPYPGTERRAQIEKGGTLPAWEWIQAMGRPGLPPPQRILVAGCGSGAEAFFVRRQFPRAEIVAVDFSPRSITLARRLQRAARFSFPIQFLVGDLTDPKLADQTGGNFDLITCHGVLSYIPEPETVLRHLEACLRFNGALYLGVNGEAHPATRLRPWLEGFGLTVQTLPDERRLRELLGLWDILHDDANGDLATLSATYLAGDVCGAHFNNWSLGRWRRAAQETGWDMAGAGILPPALGLLREGGQLQPLFPLGIGALAEKLDLARPAGFHRLILRRAAPEDLNPLKGNAGPRKLTWTGLFSVRFQQRRGKTAIEAHFASRTLDLQFDAHLSRQAADSLRRLRDFGSLSEDEARRWTRSDTSRRLLWLWTGFGAVAVPARERPD